MSLLFTDNSNNVYKLYEDKRYYGYIGSLHAIPKNPIITVPEYIICNNIKYYITNFNVELFKQVQDYSNELDKQIVFNIKNKFFFVEDDCFYHNQYKFNYDQYGNFNSDIMTGKCILYGYLGYYKKKNITIIPNTTVLDSYTFYKTGNYLEKITLNNDIELDHIGIESIKKNLPNLNCIVYNNKSIIKNKNNKWIIK